MVQRELAAAHPYADQASVRFLAAGEYTLNFRVMVGERDAVLRMVTGSQMGLDIPQQAAYEAQALRLLQSSGRVPELVAARAVPDVLDYPYLLLSYLPGEPLDYATNIEEAARCVAAIHRTELPADHRLQLHLDPVDSILEESKQLLSDLPDFDDATGRDWNGVNMLMARVMARPVSEYAAAQIDHVVINSDLNTHNFIVNDERVWLVDWEKARIAPSLMDIAHFLLPTTTLWRDSTATRLSEGQREQFLRTYFDARPELEEEEYRSALRLARQLAALRAVSWCAWAVAASDRGDRAIENAETLAKCRLFTSRDFLEDLMAELWD